jgi:hypothetical protein
MEEQTTNVVENETVNTESLGSETQEQTIEDVQLIKMELDRLKSTNSRLLEESKKYKTQKRETDLKLLEAEGKKDEIIQTLQRELEEKQEYLREAEERKVQEKITTEVAKRATKYGCDDWDHLLMLGNTDLIDYDEESGEVKGIDLFFEDAMRNERFRKFFMKSDKIKTNNKMPSFEAIDWKSDPLPYLRKLKKEGNIQEYNKAVQELERLGLLK